MGLNTNGNLPATLILTATLPSGDPIGHKKAVSERLENVKTRIWGCWRSTQTRKA